MSLEKLDKNNPVLRAVQNLTDELGYPPTFREVGKRVGLSSPDTVYRRLLALRGRGLVVWEDGKPRTLRVVDQDDE